MSLNTVSHLKLPSQPPRDAFAFLFVTSSENEWKTRYETQVELNGQLEKQTIVVQERLRGLGGNPVGELLVLSFKVT